MRSGVERLSSKMGIKEVPERYAHPGKAARAEHQGGGGERKGRKVRSGEGYIKALDHRPSCFLSSFFYYLAPPVSLLILPVLA